MQTLTTQDFKKIVCEENPLIDVRAPIEFTKGAFLNTVNLPIMDDTDRHIIGTCYKEEGNAAATALGYERVSGDIRASRTQAWVDYFHQHPETIIYCFRGGSRSRISQEWIQEALGREIVRIEGGYKAFRNYLLDALNPENITIKPLILGGCTGSGKTLILKQLAHTIDLEGIANHRGSSFGAHFTPQPAQITFENTLAYKLIQHEAKGFKTMLLEDEGKHVGTNFIPKPLFEYFNTGSLVLVNVPLEERIQITLKEYVIDAQAEYIAALGDVSKGLDAWYTYITESIHRVKKRLGGDRHALMLQQVATAYNLQLTTGDYTPHMDWIHDFLKYYYDPMYQYQLSVCTKPIVFEGNTADVLDYLRHLA